VLEMLNGLGSENKEGAYYKQALAQNVLVNSSVNTGEENGKLT